MGGTCNSQIAVKKIKNGEKGFRINILIQIIVSFHGRGIMLK